MLISKRVSKTVKTISIPFIRTSFAARHEAQAPLVHPARGAPPSKRQSGRCSVGFCRNLKEAAQIFTLVAPPSTPLPGGEEPRSCPPPQRRYSARAAGELKLGFWCRAGPPQKPHRWPLPLRTSPPMPSLPESHTTRRACYDRRDSPRQKPQHLRASATLSRRKSKLYLIVFLNTLRSLSTLRSPPYI